MTNSKSVYERKSFSKQEWKDYVLESSLPFDANGASTDRRSNTISLNNRPCVEPSIPHLLLNYFIVMSYEESSIRMAKELGYIRNNKDAAEFNKIYKIRDRAYIRELIKKGMVLKAIDEINSKFGVEVLENLTTDSSSKKRSNEEDLHFKLLLLNLIEMIRKHHQSSKTEENSNKFILELIEYSQDKLALKAGSNKKYMKELELVMTLLLFPMEPSQGSHSKSNINLPKSLKNLYSLSLRSKIADLVNRKLLESMHPQILSSSNNGLFPDLIGLKKSQKDLYNYNGLLKASSKDTISAEFTATNLGELKDAPEGPLGAKRWSNNDWRSTTALMKEQNAQNDANTNTLDSGTGLKYEAKLIQAMKVWAWCENQLHSSDIGVPRVEGGI
ncbi:LAFE_0C10748g1_1 [Lachancea fermentati]|uniref:LAFE_0C10748g1_1 n=1 Tax=Lachancea fermentati TaxID=4955 RepID=A0A1G4MA41_LACFM|nr:LAFE_0C10748g1_1 [Lachancea fermentati]